MLDELGATGFPKTSGGSGLHVYVRIPPDHGFTDVRRAALAFAREVERRTDEVTTTWWRKDRDPRRLFVDYNQNARDHTIAAAYSVRGNPEATVSTPVTWAEVDDVEPRDCTIATVPARYAEIGDLHARIDEEVFDLAPLLEWADRDERDGAATPEPEPEELVLDGHAVPGQVPAQRPELLAVGPHLGGQADRAGRVHVGGVVVDEEHLVGRQVEPFQDRRKYAGSGFATPSS